MVQQPPRAEDRLALRMTAGYYVEALMRCLDEESSREQLSALALFALRTLRDRQPEGRLEIPRVDGETFTV